MTEKNYRIVLYCPDTNLKLHGDIYKTKGLGGGKTALIKLAHAFQKSGCSVVFYTYTDGGTYSGVQYRRFEDFDACDADVFIAFTGHKLDLSDLRAKDIRAKIRILLVGGASHIRGLEPGYFDFFYAISHYLKERLVREWGLPYEQVVAVEHGYDPEDILPPDPATVRNMHGIIFASHPSKGLNRVIDIIRDLMNRDSAFFLDIYGGAKLWNDRDGDKVRVSGQSWINHKGMVGQIELVQKMPAYGFMLHLTDYPDLQSLVIQQAKKAGIIVIASNVGGNAELIETGYDGFIIDEHYMREECKNNVIKLINCLINDEGFAEYIRNNAMKHALTWDKIAGDWVRHWDGVLNEKKSIRAIVSGDYGHKNLGDETSLSCLLRNLRTVGPNVETTVVSADPFDTEKRHKVRAVAKNDFLLLLREVEQADLIILGGGCLFRDHSQIELAGFFENQAFSAASHVTLPLMGQIYRKPVIYYAQSIGPLYSRGSFLFSRWAFSLTDCISVRDEYSCFLLTELLEIDPSKVLVTCDPTMKLDIPDERRAQSLRVLYDIPEHKKLIAVSVRSLSEKEIEVELVDSFVSAFSSFLADFPDYHIVFIPFQTDETISGGDVAISRLIAEALTDGACSVVDNYNGHEEVLALYRLADFSIGMRLHALIFSVLARTPLIAVNCEMEAEELMRELNLVNFCFDVRDISQAGLLGKMIELQGYGHAETKDYIDGLGDKVRIIRERGDQDHDMIMRRL
jgi:polysaccharide pyruvyl transferase CsaB